MVPRLASRDREVTERMDQPDCDLDTLQRTYAQFRVVNALVAGWQLTYRHHVRPVLQRNRVNTLLDIGSGGGDLPRALARWARHDGYRLQVTAIDPDPRAHAWAVRQPDVPQVSFRRALSSDLVREGCSFDLVTSNHLLHHLGDAELQDLLADSQRLARVRAVHSDISRSRWAHLLFSVGTWAFFRGSFIRADGLVSIQRSYTAEELQECLPPSWRLQQQPPWRVLVLHDAGTA
jgi:2-polyprenyl-3-methyl-5-hydroxy-6-metoxy-1,4-benzoquinol methylase